LIEDNDIEVEYQGNYQEIRFRIQRERLYAAEQKTACLAEDQCGIRRKSKKRNSLKFQVKQTVVLQVEVVVN
jgi:hypothetical protein